MTRKNHTERILIRGSLTFGFSHLIQGEVTLFPFGDPQKISNDNTLHKKLFSWFIHYYIFILRDLYFAHFWETKFSLYLMSNFVG